MLINQTERLDFNTEAEYEDYLASFLSDSLQVTCVQQMPGQYKGRRGLADIYIPIVKAVIECKKSRKSEKQARKQLEKYSLMFDTKLLFFAAPDTFINSEKFILNTLRDLVLRARKKVENKLKSMLNRLLKISYQTHLPFTKNKHTQISKLVDSALQSACVIKSPLISQIKNEKARLDAEWFKYSYFKSWFKPKCVLDARFGECWQHPKYANLWLVEVRNYFETFESFYTEFDQYRYADISTVNFGFSHSKISEIAFYDTVEDKLSFSDTGIEPSGVSKRFELRKKSCLGLPVAFENGFKTNSKKERQLHPLFGESDREYSSRSELMHIIFLLHTETRGYDDYLGIIAKQLAKYGHCFEKPSDYIYNETISKAINEFEFSDICRQRKLTFMYYCNCGGYKIPKELVAELIPKSMLVKYFDASYIKT